MPYVQIWPKGMHAISPELANYFAQTGLSAFPRVSKRGRYERHKDNLDKLEPIFIAFARTTGDPPME